MKVKIIKLNKLAIIPKYEYSNDSVEVEEVDSLTHASRGTSGFGSTGITPKL
ncbi:MAG: hypothetical protein HWQ38_07160 [Nostoc sp. NMS7]|uniref:hypothetical protein n=1 Tax=Nostoc sp. NMS7 TaxID=2815391 RepID=UPI0025F87A39|nr:hypothetical protein [Nostoc sp. NMS7]MBN3946267.1 hypothetical protein [Nostoc sp. NMS7]